MWETNRARQRSPQAREHLSATTRECVSGLVEVYVAGDGAGSAAAARAPEAPPAVDPRAERLFATIERFRARTLRERMAGPWKPAPERDPLARIPPLAEFQRSVLREGDLLLQTFLGPTAGVIVAVTPSQSRVVTLPHGAEFRERLERLRSLASQPHAAGAELEFLGEAARRTGETLLGPVRDLLAESRRVIVSPDAELGLVPWAMLVASNAPHTGPAPPAASRELVLVPSASILADLRGARAAAAGAPALRTLALAGALPGGAALPGATREVGWLGGRFANVALRADAAGRAAGESAWLEPFDVLHFAAHTSLDDEHPWRSGIRIGPGAGPGGDEYLRAERIASFRLRARLAVLSSCESAGGRINSGEGVQSLSAAFVSAGVPSVVATLWPVSDRATERFMRLFYDRLASGNTVAAAVRGAQFELRSREATRHPFYWAGFVVLGDGDVRVPLEGRFPAIPAASALAAAGLFVLWWRRGRRSRLTNAGEETLRT